MRPEKRKLLKDYRILLLAAALIISIYLIGPTISKEGVQITFI